MWWLGWLLYVLHEGSAICSEKWEKAITNIFQESIRERAITVDDET
jgi:hypothetical protein